MKRTIVSLLVVVPSIAMASPTATPTQLAGYCAGNWMEIGHNAKINGDTNTFSVAVGHVKQLARKNGTDLTIFSEAGLDTFVFTNIYDMSSTRQNPEFTEAVRRGRGEISGYENRMQLANDCTKLGY